MSPQVTLKKSKEEIKKIRARVVQDKSKILNPLEEKIKVIEKNIIDLEKELSLNTERLIIASTEGNSLAISEESKFNKVLKNKIECLYTELDLDTKNFEQESKCFKQLLEELQENNL
ncbi:MAG: hypothetical protein LBF23_00370 [Endomicrobium sp.]|nr:hypothetical protein [Endomicrobium sp.]